MTYRKQSLIIVASGLLVALSLMLVTTLAPSQRVQGGSVSGTTVPMSTNDPLAGFRLTLTAIDLTTTRSLLTFEIEQSACCTANFDHYHGAIPDDIVLTGMAWGASDYFSDVKTITQTDRITGQERLDRWQETFELAPGRLHLNRGCRR